MKNALISIALIAAGADGSHAHAEVALEPFIYSEDFESRELNAWASYPLWQDTAYDPNFRVNTMIPGDPNISIEQKVTPYANVDNYAGAQKLLDMYLVPGSSITLRYCLKTHLPVKFFKVRLAAGHDGKVDVTVSNPPTNRWERLTVGFNDFVRDNPRIAGRDRLKVNALAVLAKIPNADPAMPIYLGIDDVVCKGARAVAFQFVEPKVYKLSEWKPYIPQGHYRKDDHFSLRGRWPLDADRVAISIVNFGDRSKTLYVGSLEKIGDEWAGSVTLSWPEGLYLATLTALKGSAVVSETQFTLFIAPVNIGGNHPRLWFDREGKKRVVERLALDQFKYVSDGILSSAEASRKNLPLNKVVFDLDQFPDELWLYCNRHESWYARIDAWRAAVYNNALAYGFFGDKEAGKYAKDVLVKLCKFPHWLHPWFIKRGRHIYYPLGIMGRDFAVGYDLLYDLMGDNERKTVRRGLMNNIVLGCHKGYVEDNLVTNNTSNWVAHITCGSLTCQAVMYGDAPDLAPMEPYLTGVILKSFALVEKGIDPDGVYGESAGGYYFSSMGSWAKSLPEFENVFNVDLSKRIAGSYQGLIWNGVIKEKRLFYFGDSGGRIRSLSNFAWLLDKYEDPLLGWLYHHCGEAKTLMDVLYDTENAPQKDPYSENPVRLYRRVGRTVFKSGWEPDDFVFVMQTGAFYNHQHLDQGSFWLGDRGSVFIEERHGSTYYNDPLYQPWYTQPIAHSTVLIDRNHQSQRVGDPLAFAEGFHDHAFVYHFLDGQHAAFVSGDIGRLYWGKVKSLRRNVIYLRPRTLLMLDTVAPAQRDVDVTLLYQTAHLEDITAGQGASTITKDSNVLHVMHIAPERVQATAVETPHYLSDLMRENPLIKEGMLAVSARTDRIPLVMANLLTTTSEGKPDVHTDKGDGFVSGAAGGTPFAFSTRLQSIYETNGMKTDALALTWSGRRLLAAVCTYLARDSALLVASQEPVTCEIAENRVKYCLFNDSEVALGVSSKPERIRVNGEETTAFRFDAVRKAVVLNLPAGEGAVTF